VGERERVRGQEKGAPMDGYRKNPMFVARKVEGEGFLVPLAEDLKDIKKMHRFNDLGWYIWENMGNVSDIQGLSALIAGEFDIDETTAARDAEAFLKDLARTGALIEEKE
jgi:hypothetical protein